LRLIFDAPGKNVLKLDGQSIHGGESFDVADPERAIELLTQPGLTVREAGSDSPSSNEPAKPEQPPKPEQTALTPVLTPPAPTPPVVTAPAPPASPAPSPTPKPETPDA